MHPLAPPDVPLFVAGPDGSDVLFSLTSVLVVSVAIWAIGFSLYLYHLPASKGDVHGKTKRQIVLLLTSLALLTGNNALWIVALFIAVVSIPDVFAPLRSLADSAATLAEMSKKQNQSTPKAAASEAE